MNNPMQANDWQIKRFPWLVLTIQLAMLGLVGVEVLGFDIPVLRQMVGFIYLSFIPGIIILRILRLHQLNSVETLLYSVGLSLAFNMFLGFFMNLLYPYIGITRPLFTHSVAVTWTIALGILCFVAYKRDGKFAQPLHLKVDEFLSPPVLLLLLLPSLAGLGAHLVNFYSINTVLIIVLALISVVPFLVMFTRFIPERLYSLAIFSVGLSLVWHFSLVSRYLVQWDSFLEYHFFTLVNESGWWNLTLPHSYNAMLSITILPSIFSQLLNISGAALFKVIYPLWLALVPLGLYEVYRTRVSNKQAFLSAFFVLSISMFYNIIPSIHRMMVAELFVVLLLMVISNKEMTIAKRALLVTFMASLAVSHYSLSYLYLGFLLLSFTVLSLLREKVPAVTAGSAMLLAAMSLGWYMYTANSVSFTVVVLHGQHIYYSVYTELLNPAARDVSFVFTGVSPTTLHLVNRVLYYLILFFAMVGAIRLLSDLKREKSAREYATIALGNYVLLGACIIIPFFSNLLGVHRMFHISSLVLAPYYLLGAEAFFGHLSRAVQFIMSLSFGEAGYRFVVTVIFVLFYLFNTGLPYEVADDPFPTSLPLTFGYISTGTKAINTDFTVMARSSTLTEQEVLSAEWLKGVRDKRLRIYGTYWQLGSVPVLVSYGMISPKQIIFLTPFTTRKDMKGKYIYLGYVNVVLGYGTTMKILGRPDPYLGHVLYWDISEISHLFDGGSKVYSNGASEVYWSP